MCRHRILYFAVFHAVSWSSWLLPVLVNADTNLTDAVVDQLNISTSDCTPDDFAEDGNCTLTCFVSTEDTNYRLIYYTFVYYSVDPEINVTLFDVRFSVGNSFNNYTHALSLPLSNHSSGSYRCLFTLQDGDAGPKVSRSATFQLATSPGVNLNSFCNKSSDCLARNSRCADNNTQENSICKCEGYFNISYNEFEDSPACLQPVLFHGHCNIDAQCPHRKYPIKCINHICKVSVANRRLLVAEDITTQLINKLNGIHITIIVVSVTFFVVIAISVILIILIRNDKFLPFVRIIQKQEKVTYKVEIALKDEEKVETIYYQSEATDTNHVYESLQPQRLQSSLNA